MVVREKDFVRTIEAIYAIDRSLPEWLGGVLESSRPWLDRGAGMAAYSWTVTAEGVVEFGDYVALGEGPMPLSALAADMPSHVGRMVAQVMTTNRCGLSSRVLKGECSRFFNGALRAFGKADAIGINGRETERMGVWIGSFLQRSRPLARGEERLHTRIARHLAAGSRLRRRLGGESPGAADVAAILTPVGRFEHAGPSAKPAEARIALREAVLAMDRARGAERRADPDGAVRRWRVLADARFSLIDRFESDGRRYIVACENEVATEQAARLTPRERQIVALYRLGADSKIIAYELGLADATVRVLLSRAARRLGVVRPRSLRAAERN